MICTLNKKHRKIYLFTAIIFILFINQPSFAVESVTGTSTNITHNSRNMVDINYYDLQLVAPEVLAQEVEELQNGLVQEQLKLKVIIKDKKFSPSDILITVIMPGGLFYAGYRINEQNNAKKLFLMTTEDINDLTIDLIALTAEFSDYPTLRLASSGSAINI